MTATATKNAEVLDTYGSLHVVAVGRDIVTVADHGDRYEVVGSTGEVYKIFQRAGRVTRCTCPAQRFGKTCKHKLAVTEILRKW